MIITNLYFLSERWPQVFSVLMRMESHRPTYFGESEDDEDKRNRIDDAKRFERFAKANPLGYILFADRCLFSFMASAVGPYAQLLVSGNDKSFGDNEARELFDSLGKAAPDYAFCCDYKEYLACNQYRATFGVNRLEGWVGRDLRKYISGVYWLTYLSRAVMDRLDLTQLGESISGALVSAGSDFEIIEMVGRAEDWSTWRPAVDRACLEFPGVFSLSRVRQLLEGAKTMNEYSALVRPWR